ncbi:GNAT family N-acetyltransferase/peptidase C39 family protein [Photobacterium sp. MCCC 1A19761]|uniref:GNAT family N-acetyltransferase/peptidase C39 family protein n=1 Tax=Photobacterium sp. MCCC 1A19761 TaxID=3115000 RepID=UPI00307D3BC1
MKVRTAQLNDLDSLNTLEAQLFDGDRISPRQMRRFIKSPQSVLFLAEEEGRTAGYGLVLFHRGTQLARLYSLAVDPDFRGRRLAQQLLAACETAALENGFNTLRLEVRHDNLPARNLYEKCGYSPLKVLIHYYDDLADGIRMQKRLTPVESKWLLPLPLYVQTTPFTCGPACLMMSLAYLQPGYQPSRQLEMQLWREATTIFMASGHGGCSGHGLALAANRRGCRVELWAQSQSTPFIDSVRDPKKKEIIELVHLDFCQQLDDAGVAVVEAMPSVPQIEAWLRQGCCLLMLISTYRFNGCKEPHWILLTGVSEQFFFFHDPFAEDRADSGHRAHVPLTKAGLSQVLGFGRQKQTACVVLRPDTLTITPPEG